MVDISPIVYGDGMQHIMGQMYIRQVFFIAICSYVYISMVPEKY